jgi:hypothetical protein
MREHNEETFSRLQPPNLAISEIHAILNQGGYWLKKLPLYFPEHAHQHFKPEVPSLLAVFLRQQFQVDVPWLKDSEVDPDLAERRVSDVLNSAPIKFLPLLILNPFNKDGVALHCIGVDCRYNTAVVWDPANVNSFAFTLQNLNAVCDGNWTPSFRHIWCICCR